jgi:hypothetical protein
MVEKIFSETTPTHPTTPSRDFLTPLPGFAGKKLIHIPRPGTRTAKAAQKIFSFATEAI